MHRHFPSVFSFFSCPFKAVPLAAGPGSSSQPCSSLHSAWRTSWPACSFHPSPSAAHRCRSFSLLSACYTLQNKTISIYTVVHDECVTVRSERPKSIKRYEDIPLLIYYFISRCYLWHPLHFFSFLHFSTFLCSP